MENAGARVHAVRLSARAEKGTGSLPESYAAATARCGELSRLLGGVLPPLLEKILARSCSGAMRSETRFLQVEKLRLDLGRVRREEVLPRLEQALRAAVEEAASAAPLLDADERLGEILLFSLANGIPAWNGGLTTPEQWRRFLQRLAERPAGFLARLAGIVRLHPRGGRRFVALHRGLGIRPIRFHPPPGETSKTSGASAPSLPRFPDGREEIPVENAGLVLAVPFIRRFFARLSLLSPGSSSFASSGARRRAAVALQELLHPCEGNVVEFSLALNKILCGLPPRHAVHGRHGADWALEAERVALAMVEHWGNPLCRDAASLRRFMARGGTLVPGPCLHVERRDGDAMLYRLPWSVSIVQTPWMPSPLRVIWQ